MHLLSKKENASVDVVHTLLMTKIDKDFLRSPHTGLFSVKIQKKILAINNFFVNETKSRQPNKRLIYWNFEN